MDIDLEVFTCTAPPVCCSGDRLVALERRTIIVSRIHPWGRRNSRWIDPVKNGRPAGRPYMPEIGIPRYFNKIDGGEPSNKREAGEKNIGRKHQCVALPAV